MKSMDWARCWAHVWSGCDPSGKTRGVKIRSLNEEMKIFLIFAIKELY